MSASRREFIRVFGFGTFAMATTLGSDCENKKAAAWKTPYLIGYPALWERLRAAADRRATEFSRRVGSVRLMAEQGAYARHLGATEVETGVAAATRHIGSDGILVFALDVAEPVYVRGTLTLTPDDDRRPGLRASVLADDTLVAAPMLRAKPWETDKVTDPAPFVTGNAPPEAVSFGPFLLPAGRRCLTVAGPHFRAAGTFCDLTLTVTEQAVETPLTTFAFITDTHLCETGRPEWMNRKMSGITAPTFENTLRSLAGEGVSFVLHGGDMTEGAQREEFALFGQVVKNAGVPVYGCLGNHDVYHPSSRADALELLPAQFPGGATDYVLDREPLRFLVLDEDIGKTETREAKRDWLRKTLAADTATPTVVVWHYAPFNRGGASSCGFRLPDWSKMGKESLLDLLTAAPNVIATLNGHDHWDEVNRRGSIVHIQNAAFVEWPNSYRVFRVYADRMEWEVRQVANRGFIRESFLPEKALSWMIATRDGDLTGVIPLKRIG
jgi:hypothetical protein